jgi:lipopolysaccharide transport system permease protein
LSGFSAALGKDGSVVEARENGIRSTVEIIRVLTARNLRVRYRGSVIGVFWSALNPIAMTAVYTAIFGLQFSRYYQHSAATYAASVYVGLVALNFFVGATSSALSAVVANGQLLTKVRVHSEIFPAAAVTAYAFQLVVGAVPLFVLYLVFVTHDFLRLLLLPIGLAALIATAMGVGAIVSALYVFFRDIPHLYDLVMFFLWISTPIFYPLDIVPGHVRALLMWNPLYPLVTSLRSIVLGTGTIEWGALGAAVVTGLLALAAGQLIFESMQRGFSDRL